MNSFESKKQLKFIFTLGVNKFGSSKNDVIIIQDLRASVEVDKAGGVSMSMCAIKIFGVSQSDMNAITTTWWMPSFKVRSQVEVFAIDGGVESMVFAGDIQQAQGEYQGAPDVFLSVIAFSVITAQVNAVTPLSIKGGTNVDAVFRRIAEELKLTYESVGISNAVLTDLYEAGDIISQSRAIAAAANVDLKIDNKTLVVTAKDTPRKYSAAVISKETGLIGYPIFEANGVIFRSLYNPAIIFGGPVVLKSSLPNADGAWVVNSVSYSLESEMPGGSWFCFVRCNFNGDAITK